MTNEEIHEVEIDAQEDEAALEQYQLYMREACLLAYVQQNYGAITIRKEFLDKFMSIDAPDVEVSLKRKDENSYELRVTDIIDTTEAIALATH